jgi:Holliday junction resolvase RusA-like endonuclease
MQVVCVRRAVLGAPGMTALLHASEQAPSQAQRLKPTPGSYGQGLQFTIPGEPRGKGRPRFSRKSGRAYTDSKTESYEALAATAAHLALRGRDPIETPINVQVTVRLTPTASTSKKARAAMMAGETPCLGRFDLDNIVKAVLDGCNKIAFRDDRQIVEIYARKVASEAPGVDVHIVPWGAQ